ncbi:MAG: T9SS type A sorting domain-containing protein [Bacteroidota bacterium]|nr:T9SS type A sorting domain-containing protein [Bacteroidota bacterium]
MKTITLMFFNAFFCINVYAQWKNIGIDGGNIRTIISYGTTLLAGTNSDGILVSTDFGQNWTPANNGLYTINKKINAFCKIGSKKLVSTGTSGAFADRGLYVLDSVNFNWLPIKIVLSGSEPNIVNLNFHNGRVYAGTDDAAYRQGLFVSNDSGFTWNQINTGLNGINGPGIPSITGFAALGKWLFLNTYNMICFSDQDSVNWKPANKGLTGKTTNKLFTIDSSVYLLTTKGIYYFNFADTSWLATNGQPLDSNITNLISIGNRLFASTTNGTVFYSDNKGNSWTKSGSGLPGSAINTLYANNNIIYAGTSIHGIYKSSDNGLSWNAINKGIKLMGSSGITKGASLLYTSVTAAGIFSSSDGGNTWFSKNNGLPNLYYKVFIEKEGLLFSGAYSGMAKSNDNGNNWSQINTGFPSNSVNTMLVHGNNIYAGIASGGGVIVSGDNGNTWQKINTGLSDSSIKTLQVDNNIIYAKTNSGKYFKTIIGNTLWMPVNMDSVKKKTSINEWAIINGKMYLATAKGIYRRHDTGEFWSVSDTNLNKYSIGYIIGYGGSIFAGTVSNSSGIDNGRVFLSNNQGQSWKEVSDNLPPLSIRSISLDAENIYIAINSLWSRPLSSFTGITEHSGKESRLKVYPNPSHGILNVETHSPIQKGKIMDISGKEMLTFSNSNSIDISILQPGLYILEVTCKNNSNPSFAKFVVD